MDCEQARQLIIDFVYDELSPEAVPKLQEHLAGCEECLRYKEEIQQTLQCLDLCEELRAPVDLAALHDAIDKKRHRIRGFLRRHWPIWATTGTCCAILVMFALFVSAIRYEGRALTITFSGQEADPLIERTERILAAYREDQLNFQAQLSDELRASVAALSQVLGDYELQRDKQIAGTFQQMQVEQHQTLLAIQRGLETLASRTEDEFERSYLTMAAVADLVDSR